MTSSHVSLLSTSYLFSLAHFLLLRAPIRKKDALRGNMAGFQRERLMGQCCLALVSRALNAQLLCFRDKSIHQFQFGFLFLYFHISLFGECIASSWSYCLSFISFHVLNCVPHLFCYVLQETDWSNVHSKLLISCTDVQRSNVHDGKS